MRGPTSERRARRAVARGAVLVAVAISGFAPLALPSPAGAQTWRTAELSRQLRDTGEHRVRVHYTAGRFTLLAASAPLLYDAYVRYDETRATPTVEYDPEDRELELALRYEEEQSGGTRGMGEMRLGLTPRAALDLELELGAVEADIDFAGLSVAELRIDAGASRSSVTFGEPNPIEMRELELHTGAADLSASRLANANASEIRVGAGVGNVELDFSGRWMRNMDVSVDVALGRVRVRVPEGVGVRVEMSRVLARFEHPGFAKQGDAWVSPEWDEAERKLTLRVNTAFGTVEIERGG